MGPASEPVTVRLYAWRRFFEPQTGSYVTFDERAGLAREGKRVVIEDAQSGADVTAFVLSETRTGH